MYLPKTLRSIQEDGAALISLARQQADLLEQAIADEAATIPEQMMQLSRALTPWSQPETLCETVGHAASDRLPPVQTVDYMGVRYLVIPQARCSYTTNPPTLRVTTSVYVANPTGWEPEPHYDTPVWLQFAELEEHRNESITLNWRSASGYMSGGISLRHLTYPSQRRIPDPRKAPTTAFAGLADPYVRFILSDHRRRAWEERWEQYAVKPKTPAEFDDYWRTFVQWRQPEGS